MSSKRSISEIVSSGLDEIADVLGEKVDIFANKVSKFKARATIKRTLMTKMKELAEKEGFDIRKEIGFIDKGVDNSEIALNGTFSVRALKILIKSLEVN